MEYDLTYISLGAGRQSTALIICSALGLKGVPKADHAIFADTGDEIQATYDHLKTLTEFVGKHGIPVHVVRKGHLEADQLNGKRSFLPAFTEGGGPLMRKCTHEYKIQPIMRKVRELLGFKKGERIAGKRMARAMLGISLDEIVRVRPSMNPGWCENTYPLIDARMRVEDCHKICMEYMGYVPERSACRYCPFHSNVYWLDLKTKFPEEFGKACTMDDNIRDLSHAGVKNRAFLHPSHQPLRDIDFDKLVNNPDQLKLFGNWTGECHGICGV